MIEKKRDLNCIHTVLYCIIILYFVTPQTQTQLCARGGRGGGNSFELLRKRNGWDKVDTV